MNERNKYATPNPSGHKYDFQNPYDNKEIYLDHFRTARDELTNLLDSLNENIKIAESLNHDDIKNKKYIHPSPNHTILTICGQIRRHGEIIGELSQGFFHYFSDGNKIQKDEPSKFVDQKYYVDKFMGLIK